MFSSGGEATRTARRLRVVTRWTLLNTEGNRSALEMGLVPGPWAILLDYIRCTDTRVQPGYRFCAVYTERATWLQQRVSLEIAGVVRFTDGSRTESGTGG